jgi:molybdopterin synthase catalytic subunit
MPQLTHVCLSDYASIEFHFLGNEIHKVEHPSQDTFKGKETIISHKNGHTLIGEQAIVIYFTKL